MDSSSAFAPVGKGFMMFHFCGILRRFGKMQKFGKQGHPAAQKRLLSWWRERDKKDRVKSEGHLPRATTPRARGRGAARLCRRPARHHAAWTRSWEGSYALVLIGLLRLVPRRAAPQNTAAL